MEAREAEMWRKLGLVAMKDEVQATLAQYHNDVKSEINRMKEQLALLQGKDVDKVVADLALLRVDQNYVKGELVPGLQQNEADLRTRIEQLEQEVIIVKAQQLHKQQ